MAGGNSREVEQMSIMTSSMFPGFRFSPTDVELISFYLKKKLEGCENSVHVISEIEICKYEPWDLPAKSVVQSENEWFFFSPRGRKYPNGTQSKRATELGYWKATGKERNIKSGSNVIGTKRTLVFHIGRAPKGERTEWIMHEYSVNQKSHDSVVVCRLRKNSEFRLNDTTNQPSSSRRHLPSRQDGPTDAVAEAGGHSKECSNSFDSHPTDYVDSTSESNQRGPAEVTLAESSSYQRVDSDDEEDFYADILKDDIIKLDESSLTNTPINTPLITQKPEPEGKEKSQQRDKAIATELLPLQGTANRRINLGKLRPWRSFRAEKKTEVVGTSGISEKVALSSKHSGKCLVSIISTQSRVGRFLRGVAFVVFLWLALLMSASLVWWRVKSTCVKTCTALVCSGTECEY